VLTGAPAIVSDAKRAAASNDAADSVRSQGRRSRLVVFALGGQRQLPPLPEPAPDQTPAIVPGEAQPRTRSD